MTEPDLQVVDGDSVSSDLAVELTELFTAAFGKWPSFNLPVSQVEHLQWRLEGPSGRPSSVIIARSGGDLVGAVLAYWRRYLVNGTERLARDMVDAAVHPDAQGTGLYSSIRRYASEQFDPVADFTIGYSTHAAVKHTRSGGKQGSLANSPRVLVCPLDVDRMADLAPVPRAIPRQVVTWGINSAALWNRLRHHSPPPTGLEVQTIERFDSRADTLFERTAPLFDLIQIRDARHLNWRYCDHRDGESLVRGIHDDHELHGYVALKIERERGHIVDLMVAPARDDVAEALLQDALEQFRQRGVAYVVCWMPRHHPQLPALRRLGFLDWRREGRCAVGNNRLPDEELRVFNDSRASLHLVQGDSDGL